MHKEDLEAKVLIARINGEAEATRLQLMNGDTATTNALNNKKIDESIRQFDQKIQSEKDRLSFERKKHDDDVALKKKQLNQKRITK